MFISWWKGLRTQGITACCIWGSDTASCSDCPHWPLSAVKKPVILKPDHWEICSDESLSPCRGQLCIWPSLSWGGDRSRLESWWRKCEAQCRLLLDDRILLFMWYYFDTHTPATIASLETKDMRFQTDMLLFMSGSKTGTARFDSLSYFLVSSVLVARVEHTQVLVTWLICRYISVYI